MAVFKIKEYKLVKLEDGTKVEVKKTKEELRKETCNFTKWWYFSVRYENMLGKLKRKKSKKFATKKEAEEKEREFLNSTGEILISDLTLDDLEKEFMIEVKKNKESTMYGIESHYRLHMKEFFCDKKIKLHELTVVSVKKWHHYLERKTYIKKGKKQYFSISYLNKLHYDLVSLLDYAISEGYIKENVARTRGAFEEPKDEIVKEPDIRFHTPEQFNAYESVIDDLIWKCFVNFNFWNAPRKGEQQSLTWADLNRETWKIKIYKTLSVKVRKDCKNYLICPVSGAKYKITNTKNRKNREVDVMEESKELLNQLYEYYSRMDGFTDEWFIFGGNRFLPQTTIDRKIEHYYDKLEKEKNIVLKRLSHHELGRHSHASYLRNIGVSLETIAERLGDTTRVIEKTYAHLYRDNMKSLFLMELNEKEERMKNYYNNSTFNVVA